MTKISKIIVLTIVLLFTFALAACKETTKEEDEDTRLLVINLTEKASNGGIKLSSNKEFSNVATSLNTDPSRKLTPIAYIDINKEEAILKDGEYTDSKNEFYVAYTFYLKNGNNQDVDINLDFSILLATNKLDEATRTLVIENDDLDNLKIYMKKDDGEVNAEDKTPYNLALDYVSNDKICNNDFKLAPDEVKKYTIIIWLEGWDKECTNENNNGVYNLQMTFDIK